MRTGWYADEKGGAVLLAIDIGNTNVVLGVYDGEELLANWRVATDANRMPDEHAIILQSLLAYRGLSFADIGAVVLASVVPPLVTTYSEMFERYLNLEPLVVSPGIKTGVRVLYENPKEVGADRIANALAAHRLYGGPAVIIDFGTATTFDAINPKGDYLGGAIAPGINISAEALYTHAAKLPRIELVTPKVAIGRNTVSSMQSGLIFGYVGLVEGLIIRFKRELEGAKVIATGGLAPIIARETTLIEIVNSQLTLEGLRMLYDLNRDAGKGVESAS